MSPVIEEGVPELMKSMVEQGRIKAGSDVRQAVLESELSFITVGTPSAANGSINLSALFSVTRSLGEAMAAKDGYHVFVYRSTVTPGTTENQLIPLLEELSGKRVGVDFDVCFQPEFLREGSSIRDYSAPPFVVAGGTSDRSLNVIRSLFCHLAAPFHATSLRTAEMLKVCCNNFHAVKIAFANEVARLCEATGCDPFDIMELLCQDRQLNISPAYLKPGFAFGGSCLPKDLRSFLYLAKTRDVDLPMHTAVLLSNRIHVDNAIAKVLATGKSRVGFIGLSFKTGTDDLRESPIVLMAEQLLGKGLKLSVYDPDVHYSRLVGANRQYIEQRLPHLGSLLQEHCENVIAQSDVIVLGLTNASVIEKVRACVRPHHSVLDLAGVARSAGFACHYIGAAWD
jgi:GDP-mannose 6-dehydrogenase